MAYKKRNCDNCGKEYKADTRNLKRGWGLCCSKSCAASKREKQKPGYNPETVERNNKIREEWTTKRPNYDEYGELLGYFCPDEDPGDSMYWDSKDY
jgi:hypothetical protein